MHLPGATRLGALALTLLLSAPAGATVYEVEVTTSLRFLGLGGAEATSSATGLATVHTSGSGSAHLSTLTLPVLSLVDQVPVATAPSLTTQLLVDLRKRPDLQGGVIGNVSGAIGGTGSLTPRTVPSTGGVTWCLLVSPLPPCVAQLALPHGSTSTGGRILGTGVGGILTVGISATVFVVGAPYSVDTVTAVARTSGGGFQVSTARGFAHGPASLTSSTAASGGVLQLVTASRVELLGVGGTDISGSISRIVVVLLPEPALLTLFGAGAALLALLGQHRGRSR